MKKSIYLIALSVFFFPAVGYSGTSYYVNPKAPDGGNGSYAKPWKKISQVNNHKFKKGDDLYFKVGTTLDMTQKFVIDWDGTEKDRVIIGAYYGNGQFGLGPTGRDYDRPVLRGSFYRSPKGPNVPSGDYDALVEYSRPGAGYITVQDLEVVESYTTGIRINNGGDRKNGTHTSYNIVKNCIVKNTGGQGIVFGASWHGRIENNLVEATCLRPGRNPKKPSAHSGAAIVIMGGNKEYLSKHNTIEGNVVTKAFESIGVYRGPRHTEVINNEIYDFTDVGVYFENSSHGTISGNLIYNPPLIWWKPYRAKKKGMRAGIQVDSEGHEKGLKKETGNFDIIRNYIASCKRGINVSSKSNRHGAGQKNTLVFDNRIVDSTIANLALTKSRHDDMSDVKDHWENNEINGNYFFIFEGGGKQVLSPSWPGVTWRGNHFNSKVTGDAAFKAKINQVELKKKIEWNNLTPGSLKISDFEFKMKKKRRVIHRNF